MRRSNVRRSTVLGPATVHGNGNGPATARHQWARPWPIDEHNPAPPHVKWGGGERGWQIMIVIPISVWLAIGLAAASQRENTFPCIPTGVSAPRRGREGPVATPLFFLYECGGWPHIFHLFSTLPHIFHLFSWCEMCLARFTPGLRPVCARFTPVTPPSRASGLASTVPHYTIHTHRWDGEHPHQRWQSPLYVPDQAPVRLDHGLPGGWRDNPPRIPPGAMGTTGVAGPPPGGDTLGRPAIPPHSARTHSISHSLPAPSVIVSGVA
eukprot:gene3006-biopygen9665